MASSTSPRSRRNKLLTTSRMGRTSRRSTTSDLRTSKERRCTSAPWGRSSNSRSSRPSRASSSCWTVAKCPSTTKSSSPHSRNPTPWPARSAEPSQRSITPWMSKVGSLRTVISAPGGDERGQLAFLESAGGRVQADGIGGQERVVLVAVEFGPLMLLDGVLDRQRVQPELLRDERQVLLVGLTKVQQHHRVRLL